MMGPPYGEEDYDSGYHMGYGGSGLLHDEDREGCYEVLLRHEVPSEYEDE